MNANLGAFQSLVSTFHPRICSFPILLMPQALWRSQTGNSPGCVNHWILLLLQLEGGASMAHLLCHLEFLTMDIHLTNLISPFSAM